MMQALDENRMTSRPAATATGLEAVRAALAEKPDGVLESLAEAHSVRYRDVLDCLPHAQRLSAAPSALDSIWADVTTWGPIMFIVHTRNGVFETKGPLPPGSHGRGYFNIHGDSPIGGHINVSRCVRIYFIDRIFFGRRSCSLQFIDSDGEAMFKIFVGRDSARELLPHQVARFEALRTAQAG